LFAWKIVYVECESVHYNKNFNTGKDIYFTSISPESLGSIPEKFFSIYLLRNSLESSLLEIAPKTTAGISLVSRSQDKSTSLIETDCLTQAEFVRHFEFVGEYRTSSD
jgi:hypothetical protein